jgi:hypothetical protein
MEELSKNPDIDSIKFQIETINESLLALERQEQNVSDNPAQLKSIEVQRDQLQTKLNELEEDLTKF